MKRAIPLLMLALLVSGCAGPAWLDRSDGRFTFGVIADVQYADKDTKGARAYRPALGQLKKSVQQLNREDLVFTIQLGDIIDGNSTPEKTHADLADVMRPFKTLKSPLYHVVGNHCLEADREVLAETLGLTSFYYDFTEKKAPGWRFVVLDGDDAGYGVLGEDQLAWLEKTLAQAQSNHERVIIFNHFAVWKDAAKRHHMKKPDPLLQILDAYDCVAAYFAGHDHSGGYAVRKGVHHITVKGMVEAPIKNAFATITVTPDQLIEKGFGKEPDRLMPLKPME
jgi:hypothetical protein